MSKELSIVLTNRNNCGYLKLCLDSIFKNTKDMDNKEIIIVDDNSTDDSDKMIKDYVKDHKNISFLKMPNVSGLAQCCNIGVSFASGKWVIYTNEDTVFPEDWEKNFYKKYRKEKRLACCNLIEPGKYVQVAKGFTQQDFGTNYKDFNYAEFIKFEKTIREKRTIKAMNGPQLFAKKDYMSIGGCDPLFSGVSLVDTDFFIRWRLAGYDSIRTYESAHYHFSGKGGRLAGEATQQRTDFIEIEKDNLQKFMSKWGFIPFVENGLWSAPKAKIRGIDFSKLK